MTFKLREIRRTELTAAIDLARAVGSDVDPQRVVPALSVSASQDGELVAVLLAVGQPGVGGGRANHRMELCLGEPAQQSTELGRALVDAALAKTRSQGIVKSALRIRSRAGEQPVWPQVYWPHACVGQRDAKEAEKAAA